MTDRFALASAWAAKGKHWMMIVLAFGAVAVALTPVQFAVADAFWSTVIVILGFAAVAAQLAAGGRMVVCYRRAAKARRSGDTYAVASLRDGGTETQA